MYIHVEVFFGRISYIFQKPKTNKGQKRAFSQQKLTTKKKETYFLKNTGYAGLK